jgi:large subunit ribosomal protein L13e
MPVHNNALQRPHLRKHWQKWVKTWFNQPARKNRRLTKRKERAAEIFPRPLNALRPIVSKTTQRYSGQPRLGRGFSLEELRQAGVQRDFARTIGLSVDHRRTNKSVESTQRNVNRLKAYLEKLVLLPKRTGKPCKGNHGVLSDATEVPQLVQNLSRSVVGRPEVKLREKPVVITKEMKDFKPYRQLRQERTNQKWHGKRALRVVEAKE